MAIHKNADVTKAEFEFDTPCGRKQKFHVIVSKKNVKKSNLIKH